MKPEVALLPASGKPRLTLRGRAFGLRSGGRDMAVNMLDAFRRQASQRQAEHDGSPAPRAEKNLTDSRRCPTLHTSRPTGYPRAMPDGSRPLNLIPQALAPSGLLALLPLLALLTLVAIGCTESTEEVQAGSPASAHSNPPEPAAPFELAPTFALERLDGGTIDLAALRGKTVVIDFWATWCVPCEAQVAVLNAVYDAHQEADDVKILGISIDTLGAQVVGDWVHEKGVRYPVLMGSMDLLQAYVADGNAGGVPLLVIVGPDGSIDSRHLGSVTRDDLEAALARERG